MQASSIGIIGGADGPTAIYVAGKLSPIIAVAGIGAAALVALGVWLFLKHK
ncbi:MAG: sodium ion-translocating decarboxylase subunit beta [Candidatus Fimivivens sp.]|nr:sodium ion-translocating decarboxylase subunit beta [Candidatus Fimivivens sp.]